MRTTSRHPLDASLVDAPRAAQAHAQQFSLRSPNRVTQRVLDMTGVSQLVDVTS